MKSCSLILLLVVAHSLRCQAWTTTTTATTPTAPSLDLSSRRSGRKTADVSRSPNDASRRQFLSQWLLSTVSLGSSFIPQSACAQDETSLQPYVKRADKFGYTFQPPLNFDAGNKPLKTHLDEINFKSLQQSGYQFGITVDPVRITSLQQFGTPEEVAAKVVLAEVNRDGVFDVTLMQDPQQGDFSLGGGGGGQYNYYQLNYLSQGKRGDKRFVTKFYIQNQFLYALTAQCKEVDYKTLASELLQAVDSFQVTI